MLSLHSSPSLFFSPFTFSFPSVLYDLFSHTLYIHPLSSGVLHSSAEKKQRRVGCAGGCTDWNGLCVCASVFCFARLSTGSACLLACLHCCSFLCGLPANFMIYSAKGRGARPPVTTERAPHVGLMISPQKCLLWLGPLFQGHGEREKERHTGTHCSHPLADWFAFLLGSITQHEHQEETRKTDRNIVHIYSICSTPMYIWCWWNGFIGTYSMFSLTLFVKFSLFLLFDFQEHISGRVTKTGRASWCN